MNNEVKAIESLFYIQTKETNERVPFLLNNAQKFLDKFDNPLNRVRIIIAKARQKGFSAGVLAKFAVRCLGRPNTRAVCISHEASATQRLLDRVDYYIKHMNGPKPVFGRHSRMEMFFEKMDSTFYIGTAGAKAFGRGDTITDLHCSEYAWWEDPVKHSAGLFQAVPYRGRIYIESTGNGRNNDFYYIWEHAEEMGFHRLFYPWFADDEYQLPLPGGAGSIWKPDLPRHAPYLLEMQARHKVSDSQMFWYESKLKELREDLALMQQEYPFEAEECFQATGGALFPNVDISYSPGWQTTTFKGYHVGMLEGHPVAGYHYVAGGDPSGGTGNDDAAINVFCAETLEQVFELYNNRISPIPFGEVLCAIGSHYNEAFVVCESNNHGAAVIPYLRDNYKRSQLFKRKFGTKTAPPIYGWNNTDTTKHALVGDAQDKVEELTFYGLQTVKEMKAFEETQKGKMEGKSDNTVIATCLCILGLAKYAAHRAAYLKALEPVVVKPKVKPNYMTYTLDEVLASIDAQRSRTQIAQVGDGYPNI